MPKVAIYLRQSKALSEGIDRQREKCTELANARGWTVAEEFADNDTSATKARGNESAWSAMLAALEEGRVTHVIAVDMDRLLRSLQSLLDLLATKAKIVLVDGEIDTSTADGEFRALMLTGIASFETKRKTERQQRANAYRASQGRPNPGGRRAYGWETDGVTLREPEAAVVRRMASELLAGESVSLIVRRLNDEGIPTAQGGEWSPTAVRKILKRHRNVGQLTRLGEPVTSEVITPILDQEDYDTVCALLERRSTPGRKPEKSWLSGILTCGTCGGPLVMRTVMGPNSYKVRVYGCKTRIERTKTVSGTHPAIKAELAERSVSLHLYALARMGVFTADRTEGERREVLNRLAELAADASDMTEARMVRGSDKRIIDKRLGAIEDEREQLSRKLALLAAQEGPMITPNEEPVIEEVLAWLEWLAALPLERRRALAQSGGTYTLGTGRGADRLEIDSGFSAKADGTLIHALGTVAPVEPDPESVWAQMDRLPVRAE